VHAHRHPSGRSTGTAHGSLVAAVGLVVCVLLAALTTAPPPARAGTEGREALVKAAFLYHFLEFVDWPDSVTAGEDGVVRIGVLGSDPFGPKLDEVFRSSDDVTTFRVLRSTRADDLVDCRLVFVSSDAPEDYRTAIDVLAPLPVLTVAHHEGFAADGGHMNFFVENDRLRFEVNLAATEASGLRLSSRLLKLARIVEPTSSR